MNSNLPPLTDAWALLGIALVLCAVGLRGLRWFLRLALPGGWQKTKTTWVLIALLLMTLAALLAWPVGEAQLPMAAYVRGISSDLSVSLVLLALFDMACCAGPLKQAQQRCWPAQEFSAFAAVVAVAALILYPLALGAGNWDPYRLGWAGNAAPLLLILLLLCGVCLLRFRLWLLPVLVALAVAGWSVGLLESGNLWDYLFDVWLALLCLGYTLRRLYKTGFARGVRQ